MYKLSQGTKKNANNINSATCISKAPKMINQSRQKRRCEEKYSSDMYLFISHFALILSI